MIGDRMVSADGAIVALVSRSLAEYLSPNWPTSL